MASQDVASPNPLAVAAVTAPEVAGAMLLLRAPVVLMVPVVVPALAAAWVEARLPLPLRDFAALVRVWVSTASAVDHAAADAIQVQPLTATLPLAPMHVPVGVAVSASAAVEAVVSRDAMVAAVSDHASAVAWVAAVVAVTTRVAVVVAMVACLAVGNVVAAMAAVETAHVAMVVPMPMDTAASAAVSP